MLATLPKEILDNTISLDEVAKHVTDGESSKDVESDIWLVVDGVVADVSKYEGHPGGFHHLVEMAGQDATEK